MIVENVELDERHVYTTMAAAEQVEQRDAMMQAVIVTVSADWPRLECNNLDS